MTLVLKDEYLPVPPTAAISRRFVVLLFLALCAAGIAFTVYLSYYHLHVYQGAARTFARVLPLPVGHVDGRILWYAQVSERANALVAFAEMPSDQAVAHAVEREQRNILLTQLADSLDVQVTNDEVDAFIAQDAELVALKSVAGWSERQYREEVYRYILAQKTEHALFASDTHQAYARGRAEKILLRLADGIAFADLAPYYSDGETAAWGGDLGYVDLAVLPEPLAAAARTLPIDEVSDILETEKSFWLLMVEDRLPVDAQGAELVWVRVMEVKKDLLGDILTRVLATTRVANWLD